MGIINWLREYNKEIERDERAKINNWSKKPMKFKMKLMCTDCKYIFSIKFKDGEMVSSRQDWTGHYAYLESDSPKNICGFINCPLCNRSECKAISIQKINRKVLKLSHKASCENLECN